MQTYPIWHWLIVLLLLLIPFFLIAYARRGLTRSGFALRLAGSLAAAVIAYWVADAGYEVAILPIFVLTMLTYRWTAMRLNDAGWSRWWALLWYVWPVALALAVTLCFKGSAAEDLAPVFD